MMIAELERRGTHFKAIVNRKTESILATGIILENKFFGKVIPAVHDFEIDPIELLETGDRDLIMVNGNTGEVIELRKSNGTLINLLRPPHPPLSPESGGEDKGEGV